MLICYCEFLSFDRVGVVIVSESVDEPAAYEDLGSGRVYLSPGKADSVSSNQYKLNL
jgi:hypothetical protein